MSSSEVLERLIAVCIDSEKRYQHAANDVGKQELEQLFNRQAAARKRDADELQLYRERIYGESKESGTFSGMIDRMAMDFNVAMSMGDTGVVDWCKQNGQAVISEYEKALSENLPSDARAIVGKQLKENRAAVDQLEHVLQTYGGPRS